MACCLGLSGLSRQPVWHSVGCRDLRALLKLVTNVLQRDLLDFSDDSDSGEAPVDVAQASWM